MKTHIFVSILLFFIFCLACEKRTYYDGKYVIVNQCDEPIDSYAIGKNAPGVGPSVEIHDHIPAKSALDLRKISITENAKISDIFVDIKIYRQGQISKKDVMNQKLWKTTLEGSQITHTLFVDYVFFTVGDSE